MRNIIILFLMFLSTPAFSGFGGGDSGGGPKPEVGREFLRLTLDATRISFADMELVTVRLDDSEQRPERVYSCQRREGDKSLCRKEKSITEERIKISIKYSTPEVRCVENKRGRERCFDRFSVRYKYIYFEVSSFSKELLSKLESRKMFSKKKIYAELANKNMSLDIVNDVDGKLVVIETL